MNSSGIKKGLAATAISALAITGIPALASPASADSITQQQATDDSVSLYAPDGIASVRSDGTNTTIHLLAGGGDNVAQVRFEYVPQGGGAAVPIATVSRTNGVFSTEWAPGQTVLNTTVQLRAVALGAAGNPIDDSIGSPSVATEAVTVSTTASAIDIANAAGSTLPVFPQPYGVEAQEGVGQPGNGVDHSRAQGAISGTTSGADPITVSDLSDPDATPAPQSVITPSDAGANGIRTFEGAVNFRDQLPLDTAAGDVNEAIVGVEQESDDAEVVNLVTQSIAGVTAVADPASVPEGTASKGIVTVVDSAGRPVVGAQVIDDRDRDGVWDATEESYYTNADGQAIIDGLTDAPGGGGTSYDFFVNTTGGDDFDPATDFRRTVTVTANPQVETTLTVSSRDGAAFDEDEYVDGDVTAKLVDQNGAPIANRAVSYRIVFTPATVVPGTTYTPQVGSAATNAQGVAEIPVNLETVDGSYTVQVFRDSDGTPGQGAGDLAAAPLTFKAGDSDLEFNEDPESASAGTTATFEATLELFDGTPLPGRVVDFTYSSTGNAQLAPAAGQPAGTTRDGATATDTTDENGVVSVAVTDPATASQTAELGGTLNAVTDAGTVDNDDPDESDSRTVDFGITSPPAGITDVQVVIGATADNDNEGVAKPGAPLATQNTVTVTGDSNGAAAGGRVDIAGIAVTLTVNNEGFFTNGGNDPAAAPGNDTGELSSRGDTVTVITDANGEAQVPRVGMERNEDFDDDGLAEAIVTATVAGATDTEDYDFNSAMPLNGGSVELVQVEGREDGPTRIDSVIGYDVNTTDQFGNAVGGATVSLSENGSDTTLTDDEDAAGDNDSTVASDFDDDADVFLEADAADEGTLTATWNAPFSEFGPTTTAAAPVVVTGTRNLTDTADFAFYVINFEESTFTLAQQGPETVPVGSRVTQVLTAIDQEGQPIAGLEVEFLRSGPSNEDSDGNDFDVTDENGNAFYDFVGGSEGTANVSAVVRDNGTRITSVDDTVTFGDPVVPPVEVIAKTKGKNNGPRADRLIVRVNKAARDEAADATVKLIRVNVKKLGSGKKTKRVVRTGTLGADGRIVFTVNDRNGRGPTRYFSRVMATEDSQKARGNNRVIR